MVFVSMQAVIKFVLRAVKLSTSESADGEQQALPKFSASRNFSFITRMEKETLFFPE